MEFTRWPQKLFDCVRTIAIALTKGTTFKKKLEKKTDDEYYLLSLLR